MRTDKEKPTAVIVDWIVRELFSDDIKKAAMTSGCSSHQIKQWRSGLRTPHKASIKYLMHKAFEPDYRVIIEFQQIDPEATGEKIRTQLGRIFKGFERACAVYAFYDSSGNLLYLGKANGTLLDEVYQQLRKNIKATMMPRGVRGALKRQDITRYISAYLINSSEFEDYAKHVEALILRINKPRLNSVLGKLTQATASMARK